MKLILRRVAKRPTYTIGKLYINGVYFADTIEDKDRGLTQDTPLSSIKKIKVPSETAIPTGTYKVDMNTVSPKYSNPKRYSYVKKYGAKMPRLLNVPGFSGILIHAGNKANPDSSGCILVGENKVKGMVVNSQKTWQKLMDILLTDKDNIEITIE